MTSEKTMTLNPAAADTTLVADESTVVYDGSTELEVLAAPVTEATAPATEATVPAENMALRRNAEKDLKTKPPEVN